MLTFKDLAPLARKYNYDLNHNLRYLALAKLIEHYRITEILILGCGKGILEYVLSEEVKCTSVDIDQDEIKIAKEVNSAKKNRCFIVGDMLEWIKNSKRKYQAVLVSEALEHLGDDKGIIKSIRGIIESNNGLFLLTVPNINRFINRIYPLVGREHKFMSDEHLREYRLYELYDLLSSCWFKVIRTEYVFFGFPKEAWIRKIISVNSRLRKLMLKINQKWGSYIITVSLPSEKVHT